MSNRLVNTHPHDEYPVFDREGRCLICQRNDLAEAMHEMATRSHDIREALAELVTLKDGPRDEDYLRRKPLAWQRARDLLSECRR